MADLETRVDKLETRVSSASFRNLTLAALFVIGGMSIAAIVLK